MDRMFQHYFLFVSQLRICPTKDIDTPHLPILRSGHFYIKDGDCPESNEKSSIRFFRFLVLMLLASKELPIGPQKKLFKSGKIYWKDWDWYDWFFAQTNFLCEFLVFEIWSIFFPFVMHSGLGWNLRKKNVFLFS